MIGEQARRAREGKVLVLGLLVATLVVYCLVPSASRAQIIPLEPVYTVNATNDDADSNPGDLSCDSNVFLDGEQCTLRAAIQEANSVPGKANITLPAGEYTLTIPDRNPFDVTVGDLDIRDDLAINGAGARATIVRGGAAPFNDGIFRNGAVTTTISDLTVTDGKDIGIINVFGTLTMHQVSVVANTTATTVGGVGGNGGTLTITDSTVSGNKATSIGGIAQFGGTATITNSTVSGNQAASAWGGISALESATVNIRSSTVANNTSANPGGGIRANGAGSVVNVRNTIVSNNSTDNCVATSGGTITSTGNNLDSTNTCDFARSTDKRNTDPFLALLANNGGPTNTHALIPGSPAIDSGVSAQSADQRGVSRPQNGDNNASAIDDIGAFERGDSASPRVVNVIPADNAAAVSPTANVVAVSNEPMLRSTITPSTFTLRKSSQTQKIGATRALDPATKRATLNPANVLTRGATYIATLTPGARDVGGNQLDQDPNATGHQPKSWRFTVRR